jgi:hypothetical protein
LTEKVRELKLSNAQQNNMIGNLKLQIRAEEFPYQQKVKELEERVSFYKSQVRQKKKITEVENTERLQHEIVVMVFLSRAVFVNANGNHAQFYAAPSSQEEGIVNGYPPSNKVQHPRITTECKASVMFLSKSKIKIMDHFPLNFIVVNIFQVQMCFCFMTVTGRDMCLQKQQIIHHPLGNM